LKISKTENVCVCDDGYMWNSTENKCLSCADNFYSNDLTKSICMPCPVNSISKSPASLCQCAAGYQKEQEDFCAPCAPGTYKTYGDSTCEPCPANMSSRMASTDSGACWCLPGFERHDSNTCVVCAANDFCPGFDAKITCPPHSSSAIGAKTIKECICAEGFFWYDEACLACEEGFFCSQGIRSQCPPNSTSAHASTHASNCTCLEGFENL